jgi:hypothetical protein
MDVIDRPSGATAQAQVGRVKGERGYINDADGVPLRTLPTLERTAWLIEVARWLEVLARVGANSAIDMLGRLIRPREYG